MPKFVTIGYGDQEDYDRTAVAVRNAAHEHDERLRKDGVLMGIAGTPVQVRNPNAAQVEKTNGPFMISSLPLAGSLKGNLFTRIIMPAVLLMTVSLLCFFSTSQATESPGMRQDRLRSMLAAVNEIRLPRDIDLDCSIYVYPYLGNESRLGYYIDLFASNGIPPSVVRQHSNYHVGFEIGISHLKSVPNSKFGALDSIAIVFIAKGHHADSAIHRCKAILKAAPQFP